MSNLSKGKFAQFISDRSGQAFPYSEMVTEWNGSRVHISEFEPKQPQLEPKPHGGDPQGLPNARPARVEPATQDFLPDHPFTTTSNTVLKISSPNGDLEVNDFVRFKYVKSPVGGVPITTLQLSTTLNTAISTTDTTIILQTGTAFPSSGYIIIEKILTSADTTDLLKVGTYQNEVIKYTGRTGNNLTGCIRGTSAPYRGVTYGNTTAGTHLIGAKVYGSYKVISLNTSSENNPGQPTTITQFDGINCTLVNAATSSEKGGGFQCTIGPVNDRA
jgi:hypothetical protein